MNAFIGLLGVPSELSAWEVSWVSSTRGSVNDVQRFDERELTWWHVVHLCGRATVGVRRAIVGVGAGAASV